MSIESHYAEIRAKFFPRSRPIVKEPSVYARRAIEAGLVQLKQDKILRAVEKALEVKAPAGDTPLSMMEIAKDVAKKHGLKSWRELMKHQRAREIVFPRQEAMWRCRDETN